MFQQAIDSFAGITLLQILAFLIPFIIAIWIDLRAHRGGKAVSMGDAALWSVIWILCALSFGAFVFLDRGPEAASLYITGYVLEKALAVDNLFAFFLIFKSFGLTLEQNQPLQHRILYWVRILNLVITAPVEIWRNPAGALRERIVSLHFLPRSWS